MEEKFYNTLEEIMDDIDDARMETDYDTPNDPVVIKLCDIIQKLQQTIESGYKII